MVVGIPNNQHRDRMQKGIFLPPALFTNAHLLLNTLPLLPSWEQKSPFFACGLKLCKTLTLIRAQL